MSKVVNSIYLGVGNISHSEILGNYYQDFTQALLHYNGKSYACVDKNGIPYKNQKNQKVYSSILAIQYALICHDLYHTEVNAEENRANILRIMNWLDENSEVFKDAIIWRSIANDQYDLPEGWFSGMYQGQAISLYLRAYQLFEDEKYLDTALKVFNSFKYDYSEGGFKRVDKHNCIWFEEYPTPEPSYVLNGFIFAIWGIYDLYRVTKNQEAKELWDSCVNTLEVNLHKYDVWYWSVYDQLKEQLVSYYYQKNVHIPIMQVMYGLTEKEIFNKYAIKWEKNLNNPFHRFITQIMYRVQPRLKKIL